MRFSWSPPLVHHTSDAPPICAFRDKSISARPDKKNGRPLQRGFRSRTRPLVLHGPSTRTTGTSGRNATGKSAVTAMSDAHFTSSSITPPPSARTCRSAHMRPRSLPRISRSPHPSLKARARSPHAPATRAAAASLVLQSASPDSSSQLAAEQIEGFCPKAAAVLEEAEAGASACLDFPYKYHARLRTDNVQDAPTASSSAAAAWCRYLQQEIAHQDDGRRVRRDGRGLGWAPKTTASTAFATPTSPRPPARARIPRSCGLSPGTPPAPSPWTLTPMRIWIPSAGRRDAGEGDGRRAVGVGIG